MVKTLRTQQESGLRRQDKSGGGRNDTILRHLQDLEARLNSLESEKQTLEAENAKLRRVVNKPEPRKKLGKRLIPGCGTKFMEVDEPVVIRLADINAGRYYKSRGGDRIQIFRINKDYPHSPVIGAIEVKQGVWETRTWTYDGGAKDPAGANSNIVGFWEGDYED